MDITNETALEFGWSLTSDDPRSVALTGVLKGTFILQPQAACTPAKTQLPLAPDKIFMDELGRGPAWATDYAPFKPHADDREARAIVAGSQPPEVRLRRLATEEQ